MLCSLTQLKTFLMPPAMRVRTDFDDQLQVLGDGVEAMMENYCNRRFAYAQADVYQDSADKYVFSLPRFPLVAINDITLQTDVAIDINSWMRRADLKAGLLHLTGVPGTADDAVVINYEGGFWWDASEDQSGTLPDGVTALPADLVNAFKMQMSAVCEAADLFGLQAAAASVEKPAPAKRQGIDLVAMVKAILNPYRRFA